MNHIEQPHTWTSAWLKKSAGAILCLALLGLSGCLKNTGGDAAASSFVRVQTVLPASGPFVGGTLVRITGEHFVIGEAHTVTIGGHPATDVVVLTETSIACRTPAGTPGATVEIRVSNSLGNGRLPLAYTYNTALVAHSDVNGDGVADLIVSSPGDDSIGADAGAVYVYFGSPHAADLQNKTTAEADLKITGHHAGDAFGVDLVIGDVTGDHNADLVVGANHVNAVTANDAGAVYVFRGPLAPATLSAISANARITGESTVAGDRFGSTLEIGDVDADGTADLMVGASGHDVASMSDAGCVYLFCGGPGIVSKGAEQCDMGFDGDVANERVGNYIGCGDLNADGHADLVICSQLADPTTPVLLPNAGKVYIVWGGSSLTTTPVGAASAVFSGNDIEDRFGASAAVADVNGDGIADLIVGAPLADGTDIDVGKVYVFFGGTTLAGGWANSADVILQGQPTHDSFGRTVRTGDVNGDGVADILIGAPLADYLNDDNGRAYVFLGGTGLTGQYAVDAYATFNGEVIQGEGFGSAVSLVDYNNDGVSEILSAASGHNFGAGRLYMWMSSATGGVGTHLATQADVIFTGLETGAQFGSQLAEGQ